MVLCVESVLVLQHSRLTIVHNWGRGEASVRKFSDMQAWVWALASMQKVGVVPCACNTKAGEIETWGFLRPSGQSAQSNRWSKEPVEKPETLD